MFDNFFAVDASVTVSEVADEASKAVEISGLKDSLSLFGFGFGMVFAVLLLLMAFIAIMAFFLKKNKAAPVEEKADTPAPVATSEVSAPAPTPKAEPIATAVLADAQMNVTLNGKKHLVSVEEKLSQFVVSLGGKKRAVDVEDITEVADEEVSA